MNHLSFLKYCKTKFFAEKIASAFKGPLTKLRFEEFILLRSFRSILYESKAHKFCPKYLNCFLGLQTLKTFRTGYQIKIAVVDQVLSQSSRFLLPNWNILLWHFIVCNFIFQIAISRQFSLQFLFKFLVSLRLSVEGVEKLNPLSALLAGSSFSFRRLDWFLAHFHGFHENQRLDHKMRIKLPLSLTNFKLEQFSNYLESPRGLQTFLVFLQHPAWSIIPIDR